MELKSTIYWLLSMLTLAVCLTYSWSNNKTKTTEPIALTSFHKVQPNSFYYANNQFYANVVGELRLDIKTEKFLKNILEYDAVVIEGYQFKPDIDFSLNWKINKKTFQLPINQSTYSINPIDFQTDDPSEITDLHILISSTQELGITNSFQDVVTFQSIYLDQLSDINQLKINFSEWNDFTPVKLSSINGYTNTSNLHLKELILRLSCWLLCAALVFHLLKINGRHLMITLFLAWLISSYFFFINHIKQHNQINQAFPSEQKNINRIDRESQELAKLISAKIKTQPNQFSASEKIVLIGASTFLKLRLLHHLSEFNIALSYDLQELLNNQGGPNPVYLLTYNQLAWCKGQEENNWLENQVQFIHVDDNFCLLRKK